MLIPEDTNSRLWNYTDLCRFRDMFNFAVRNQFVTKFNAITTASFTFKRVVIHRQTIYGFRQGELQSSVQELEKIREGLRFTKCRSLIICSIHEIFLRQSSTT